MADENVDEHDDNGEAIIVEESCSKGVFRERKKVSGIWMFFVVDKSDKTKAICLNCKEKRYRGEVVIQRISTQQIFENI